jgi:hypothetical protein
MKLLDDLSISHSDERLLNLEADILCEGHFGILNSKGKVKDYIEGYIRKLEGK